MKKVYEMRFRLFIGCAAFLLIQLFLSAEVKAQSNADRFWNSDTRGQKEIQPSDILSTDSETERFDIQSFMSQPTSAVTPSEDVQPWKVKAKTYSKTPSNDKTTNEKTNTEDSEKKVEPKQNVKPQVNAGLPWNETTDGIERGAVGLYKKGANFADDNSYIFLYYDNFSVNRSLGGDVRCTVRFVVTSTLDRKLNNLSVRLKWPAMETALNFYDVKPNTDTYFVYTLVGDGCYSMDKLPNIIVNRCRVAKMSARDCASKIRWLRKN